jgi:hypothetical protein
MSIIKPYLVYENQPVIILAAEGNLPSLQHLFRSQEVDPYHVMTAIQFALRAEHLEVARFLADQVPDDLPARPCCHELVERMLKVLESVKIGHWGSWGSSEFEGLVHGAYYWPRVEFQAVLDQLIWENTHEVDGIVVKAFLSHPEVCREWKTNFSWRFRVWIEACYQIKLYWHLIEPEDPLPFFLGYEIKSKVYSDICEKRPPFEEQPCGKPSGVSDGTCCN